MNNVGNWTDNECYYVTVVDGKRVGLLLGPFINHTDAANMVELVREYVVSEIDQMAHFYSFGTVKVANGYRDGKFNNHFRTSGLWDGTCNNLSEC